MEKCAACRVALHPPHRRPAPAEKSEPILLWRAECPEETSPCLRLKRRQAMLEGPGGAPQRAAPEHRRANGVMP